MGKKPSKL